MSRQKFGQHFLTKGSILERIAAAACPSPEPLIIEIGPGRGALTEKLLKRADRVVAIEIDPYLAEHLRGRFAGVDRLEIIQADATASDFDRWRGAPIAGNLPYYVATPIIEAAVRRRAPRAVFLIQKEVAQRLSATPGSRDYGYLSVATQLFAHARVLFEVNPGAFHPPPNVDSAVVLLEPRADAPSPHDAEAFLRFVGRCFHQKRKIIRNNLAEVYGKELVETWPEAGLRAEQIGIDGFKRMFARVIIEDEA